MLDDRKAAILRELVEEYIRTGEPVSSRAIVECGLDCSSATVRNELAVLEGEGFIVKPHTSAGRIPTDRGYRYYLDHLSPGSLQRSTRAQIDSFFSTMHSGFGQILQKTSELLSEITHHPAVVLGPGLHGQTVRDAHLIPIDPGEVLLVVVTGSGNVNQAVLHLASPAAPAEITAAGAALASHLVGRVLGSEGALERGDLEGGLAPISLDVVDRALEAVDAAVADQRKVYLGGTSWMTTLWEDLTQLHRILAMLDREAGVVGLLGSAPDGTSVRLGPELPAPEGDLAVVSARYEAAGGSGRMGVFGPLRMDYRRTIRVVEEVSDALGDTLGG
ncbi:MAG: heat-inducible transcriptional repressor HrcA [Actinobacteria bacterium]|nr:heat-inducible transcriptional repressor HrcA [Actinomycetota bacterium]